MFKILQLLESSRFIKTYNVSDFKQGANFYYFKIKTSFKDGSILHIREYASREERVYSYHWQDKDKRLICRWDNAPHYKELKTFPHHKHISEDVVEDSLEIDLESVLKHIERIFEK